MEWKTTWNDPLTSYLEAFDGLIGDRRTRKTFGETVRGIIGAGSLICQQIAGQSPMLSQGKKGAQRVIRLAMGESTQRSDLDDRHLTARLREEAVEQLAQAPEEEVWLIADSSDLAQTLRGSDALSHAGQGSARRFGARIPHDQCHRGDAR
jgi:hypothetical protein